MHLHIITIWRYRRASKQAESAMCRVHTRTCALVRVSWWSAVMVPRHRRQIIYHSVASTTSHWRCEIKQKKQKKQISLRSVLRYVYVAFSFWNWADEGARKTLIPYRPYKNEFSLGQSIITRWVFWYTAWCIVCTRFVCKKRWFD